MKITIHKMREKVVWSVYLFMIKYVHSKPFVLHDFYSVGCVFEGFLTFVLHPHFSIRFVLYLMMAGEILHVEPATLFFKKKMKRETCVGASLE